MPDADENGVTIHTQFISNEENPSWMPSYSMNFGPRAMGLKSLSGFGRGTGVGASVSMLKGSDETVAMIGHRQKGANGQEDNTLTGITVGRLTVLAAADHREEMASVAGTDPLSGKTTADSISAFSLDASGVVDMLDSSVRASVDKLNKTEATGYESGSVAAAGDISVTARESSETNLSASAFTSGRGTAVGASLAVNLASYAASVDVGSLKAAGKVTLAADSRSNDNTTAVASAAGADVIRILRAAGVDLDENNQSEVDAQAAKLTEGEISGTGEADPQMQAVNARLDANREKNLAADGSFEGEATNGSMPLSSNILRSQGVRTDVPEKEKTDSEKDLQSFNTLAGLGLLGASGYVTLKNFFTGNKYQLAASVGATQATHTSNVTVHDSVQADGDVTSPPWAPPPPCPFS